MVKKRNRLKNIRTKTVQSFESSDHLDSSLLEFFKRSLRDSILISRERKVTLVSAALLVIITIIFLVPFAGKAFHIDDPMYLWTAKHILHSPLDFYGFNVNWYGTEEPMSSVMKNPPLASYYLALVGLLFGWDEVTIHLAMTLPAIFVILGIFFLARQLCPSPFEVTLISLFTPVFLVSATTVMCDVLMLSFWIWTVFFWIKGLDQNKYSYLTISVLLMTAAALSKYYGMALIPLLFAYSFFKRRRLGLWADFFIIPIVALGFYEWYTQILYGKGLLTAATEFPLVYNPIEYTRSAKAAIGLNFLGGCLAGTIFYVPFLWRRSYIIFVGIIFLIATTFLSGFATIGGYPIHGEGGIRWGIIIQFSLFVFIGLHILALAAADIWIHRDATAALLTMWSIGTLIFAGYVNWTINARSMLPLLPVAGILIVRRLEVNKRPQIKLNPAWALIPAAILAILVTWSDYSLARCGREAALMIYQKQKGLSETIWYDGYWGFRYYMESIGAKHVNPQMKCATGDIVIIPENLPRTSLANPKKLTKLENIEIPTFVYLSTLRRHSAAGFYGDMIGPLPFAFGFNLPERYFVWRYTN